MPHIKATDQEQYETLYKLILSKPILTKGHLEFLIAKLCQRYIQDKNRTYTNLHDVVYACHHAGDEFRRLYLDKREDEAIRANGNAFES